MFQVPVAPNPNIVLPVAFSGESLAIKSELPPETITVCSVNVLPEGDFIQLLSPPGSDSITQHIIARDEKLYPNVANKLDYIAQISPFAMKAHEVTVGEFLEYINSSDRQSRPYGFFVYDSLGFVERLLLFEEKEEARETTQNFPNRTAVKKLIPSEAEFRSRFMPMYQCGRYFLDPQKPVVMVDWYEAAAYAALEGGRLPTHAEWFYAACAGRPSNGIYGTDTGQYNEVNAYYNKREPHLAPADVRSFPANPWGFYNMAGGVAEWTGTAFNSVFPTGTIHHLDQRRVQKIVCGGIWSSAIRSVDEFLLVRPHIREEIYGFRLVKPIQVELLPEE